MIKGKDIYDVLSALVPLYVAMALGFGSVRWWKIFTPEQCSGINRFVAVFAVPFLSFNFISSNNIYAMNYKFLAGDSLQKVVILFFLFLWNMTRFGSFDWSITLFSLFTLPNTLVMGIPLLKSMYGEPSSSLMVQIVFLQTCIWTTMLLAMFEYRGAKILIREQFPEAALASISSLKADSDVNSLSGRDPIQADAEIGQDGKIHVVFRRSNSTLSTISNHSINNRSQNHNTNNNSSFPSSIITPRASSLSGVEIYSVHSSRDPTPRNSNFSNQIDNSSNIQRSSSQNGMILGSVGASRALLSGSASIGSQRRRDGGSALHMFVWSPSASPITEMNMMRHHSMNRGGSVSEIVGTIDSSKVVEVPHETNASKDEEKSIEIEEKATYPLSRSMKKVNTEEEGNNGEREAQMPSAGVFTRLVLMMVWRKLIRNPNTWASLLGLTWSLIAFRYNITMPAIVKGSFTIVSNTGMGMAMFSLGLFMALQPKVIACGKKWAIISMAIRFLGGPAVIAACSAAIGIRGVLLQVEIIQAALPQAIIPFVFAKEYNLHADIFSTAVIFGMVVALPVTIIYYTLLGL